MRRAGSPSPALPRLRGRAGRRGAQQVDTGLPPRLRGGSKDVTSLVVATIRCISLQGGRRIASIAAMRRAQRNGMTDPRSAVAPSPACAGGPGWGPAEAAPARTRGSPRCPSSPHTRIPPMPLHPDTTALLVIDLQPDFMPGGALPCHEGDAVVPGIADLLASGAYRTVVATQDWHPPGHASFA